MKVSSFLGSLALVSAVAFSNQALAANITNLGNLNVAPAVDQKLLQVGALWLPDYFTFTLSKQSNVYVDFDTLAGLSIGSTFSLESSTGANLQTETMPLVTILGGPELAFNGLQAGSYRFAYNPGLLTVNVGTKVSFSAVPVPEPETNALMFIGLGLIGFIARRKFA